MTTTICVDLPLLNELADDDIYTRMPTNVPQFMSHLAGKVMHASRLIKLANHAFNLLANRDVDQTVAESERQMAKTPSVRGGSPIYHANRSLRMREQATNRETRAWAYLTAITQAQIIWADD